ncbi:MAG: hypothetical protein ACE15E_03260 [Acidobacteriota bacterium]
MKPRMSSRTAAFVLLAIQVCALCLAGVGQEPNLQTATSWWRDMENIWTAVGWKDHIYRFNVWFDGTISAVMSRHKDRSQGFPPVQVFVVPAVEVKDKWFLAAGPDDNLVIQSWGPSTAPVLRSDWARDGFIFREEVFAHVPGGADIKTGEEPLFAWVRLSIADRAEGLPLRDKVGFAVKINNPYMVPSSMSKKTLLGVKTVESQYKGALRVTPDKYDPAKGFTVLDRGDTNRLVILPNQNCEVSAVEKFPADGDFTLYVMMSSAVGTRVDLLLPFLPVPDSILQPEMSLGFEGALAEANRYWSNSLPTAANFDVPEGYITEAFKRNLQFTEVIAERDPNTGDYSLLTGGWVYGHGLWPTPTAMTMASLDLLGHHRTLEKYLKVFKDRQGTIVAPGPSYKLHPGYLSSPKTLTSIDWLSDHGALLWVISEHALLTRDPAFRNEYLPTILKACEFVKDFRSSKDHPGVQGVMPPAVATDQKVALQGIWNDGWVYRGYAAAIRLLKMTGHPRAAEFERDAAEYKVVFQKALREKTLTMPMWKDSRGQAHYQVPSGMQGMTDWQLRHGFHLDTGPMFLVFAGLFAATDDLMASSLAWFREGPPARMFRPESDCWQVPTLYYEMSSCEPCYSWNIFHSWQLGDRERYLEGMYSLLAGAYSRQTFSVCETRGGVMAATHWLPTILLARNAVIDDQISENELHLLRLVPLAWLTSEREARFENMPTEYGPVMLVAGLDPSGKVLKLNWTPKFRQAPASVILHVPPVPGLASVSVNGKTVAWNGKTKTVKLQ